MSFSRINQLIMIFIILFFIIFSFPLTSAKTTHSLPEQRSRGNIIIVDINGSGNYTTIQDAIDSASFGDTIYVWAGTYYENIIINKTLSLIGKGATDIVLDGQRIGDVVYISADWVTLSGFNIIHSGRDNPLDGSGIELNKVNNVTIANNTFLNNYYGIYLYDSKINILKNNNCFDNWKGIILESSFNNVLLQNNCSNNYYGISIKGFNNSIINNNCSKNNYGIFINGTQNNIINNTCDLNDNDGIWLTSSILNTIEKNSCLNNNVGIHLGSFYGNCNNNLVSSNICDSNNKSGIWLEYASSNEVNNNYCSNNNYGVCLSFTNNNTFRNNTIVKGGFYISANILSESNNHQIDTSNLVNGKPIFYWKNKLGDIVPPGAGQIILANCQNVIIKNQNISNTCFGIQLIVSNNNLIKNNSCNLNFENGIYLWNSSLNKIMNNNFDFNKFYGIYLYFSSNENEISNNSCKLNDGYGIYLNDFCEDNVLIENTCDLNKYNGILLEKSDRNILLKNTCLLNKYDGIRLFSSNSNMIINNTCNLNKGHGIELTESSSLNAIQSNNCSFNFYNGIDITYSSSLNAIQSNNCSFNFYNGININSKANNISYNTLLNNSDYGIKFGYSFRDSTNNFIHHNDFINNNNGKNQANDRGINNVWNTTTEGNYWSDWTTPDYNKDGIVDKPYYIEGTASSYDYYPLIHNKNLINKGNETDSDVDGYNNTVEEFLETNPYDNTSFPSDFDRDFIPDILDPDDDNDGYNDTIELAEQTNPFNNSSKPSDLDNDFIPDSMDDDIDGDGVLNEEDPFPYDPINREHKEPNADLYFELGLIFIVIIILLGVIILKLRYRK